jgi:hypothetical protein
MRLVPWKASYVLEDSLLAAHVLTLRLSLSYLCLRVGCSDVRREV